MEIIPLNAALEPLFWESVNQDILHYFYFVLDWTNDRDQTTILLALEENRIDGMMLIYTKQIVQIRGSPKAAKALLKHLDLKSVEIQALESHKPYIFELFTPQLSYDMTLMRLKKQEECLQVKHSIIELTTMDAEQIVSVMKDADPDWWGAITPEEIVEGMKKAIWLGIKIEGRLISVGRANLTKWAGIIGVVATCRTHQNREYATSVVSALVKRLLEQQSVILIHIIHDELSPPAIRVYSKVGFKPHKRYFIIRGDRIQ